MSFLNFFRLWGCLLPIFLSPAGWAQKQVTAQEVQASPAKYDGSRVFVYVQIVEFPALHINKERGFSEFMVMTADDASRGGGGPKKMGPGGDFAGGIVVRVPAAEVERFSETHAIKAGQTASGTRKKIVATFRACRSGKGGYLDLTDGSSANIDPVSPGGPHPGPQRPPHPPRPTGENPESAPAEKPAPPPLPSN